MQWLMDQFWLGTAIILTVSGLLWHMHKERVKSFMKDNPVGQAAKEAATRKAIGMIAKWLK